MKILEEITKNPRVLPDDKVKELSIDIIKGFEEKGCTYYDAHKILEEHIKVFNRAFADLGHNALYAYEDQPVKFLLK